MSTYNVSLAVRLAARVDEDQAATVGRTWARAAGLVFVMVGTARDEPWLRVSALAEDPALDPATLARTSGAALVEVLAGAGATVAEWLAVEVLHESEAERRATRPAVPPLVDAAGFAELCGVRRQRVYQWESDREAGKLPEFPAQVGPGVWLRAEALHWDRVRPRKPGPVPGSRRAQPDAQPGE